MTSVNTNVAAITALRTLQQTSNQLDSTQARISTGLKIGEAKDNAAYWAISTTLKSDNKSLATVKDALGLGSATVDVAYQGLNKAKDVLDEIKAKLTAASQAGVDKNVIQAEIGELQKQLVSIAGSSVFSGENWLSVDSSAVDYDATKKIVASFARDANNSVTIGTVDVSIGNVALFDASTVKDKNGILDGAISLKGTDGRDLDLGTANADGNTSVAGLAPTAVGGVKGAAATVGTAVAATTLGGATRSTATYASGTVAQTGGPGTLVAGNTITVAFGSSGSAGTVTFTVTATMATNNNFTYADIAAGTLSNGATFGMSSSGGNLVITNTTAGATAAPAITAITVAQGAAGSTGSASYSTAPAAPTGGNAVPGQATSSATVASAALTLGDFAVGDKVSVTLMNGTTPTTYTTDALTKAGANLAFSDIVSALNAKLGSDATVAQSGGVFTFTAAASATAKTAFSLTKLTAVDTAGVGKTLTAGGIGTEATLAKFETGSFQAVTLDADDNLYFKVQIDNATAAKNITIDQALVNKTLSTANTPVTDGKITNAADFKKVVDAALAVAGVTTVSTAVTNTDKLTFSSATLGAASLVSISDVKASAGADTVTIDTIDISDAGLAKIGATTGDDISKVMSAYIAAVNTAINKVTTAASNLGAVASRIDMQKSFVNTLMDTIDKGVGGLIDADMSEESTKLQALQVKQSLGVQALSIANQSSQNILRLFQ